MFTNLHTHSTFCDGKDTPEEMVLYAIKNGFVSLGFSGHVPTDFDMRYCMKDMKGYVAEIKKLKEKYKKDIQIYLGVEEDMNACVDRKELDYIIGSSHYIHKGSKYFPIDSNYDYFEKCMEIFDYNPIAFAENYYNDFCKYILNRKPDIVGHFDLITKFEETKESVFLKNKEYVELSKKYINIAAKSGSIFEVNAKAMITGFRTSPYPSEELLYELQKSGGKITLSSDCHDKTVLNDKFDELKTLLKYIGFKSIYYLYDNEFKECNISYK